MPQWFTELQTYVMANHQDWSSSVLFITIASFFAWVIWRIVLSVAVTQLAIYLMR